MSSRIAELLTAVMPEPTVADLPLLQASGMDAWVASRLSTGHPLRAELQAARLALLGRQMVLRRNIATLLAAWNAVGVESVLLKGFMLAEFAYPVPGLRPYGDIDILVRPEQLVSLVQAALAVGWTDDGYSRRPAEWTHEIAHLYSPDGQIRLELHRYTCAWDGGPSGKMRRITEQIWQAAESEVLEGVPVRRPSWADCALILCLGRSWSGDLGRCKPADYTDLLALSERLGVTKQALARRARELGPPTPGGPSWLAATPGGGTSNTVRFIVRGRFNGPCCWSARGCRFTSLCRDFVVRPSCWVRCGASCLTCWR